MLRVRGGSRCHRTCTALAYLMDGAMSMNDLLPDPLGVNVAAPAALGDRPSDLAGCAMAVCGVKLGVKDGDSTLRLFFAFALTLLSTC
jgi:hypothetical protein